MAEVTDEEIARQELQAHAAILGVDLDDGQLERLAKFAELLLRWNQAFNIISRKDESRLTSRHLLDSLSIAPWVRGRRVLDMGTGGGLPGIPLAICLPDQRFTLVDRNQRKIRFVAQVKRTLGLANVEPVCADVRDLPDGPGFDCVVSRALTDPDSNWRLAMPKLGGNGQLLIMASTRGAEPTVVEGSGQNPSMSHQRRAPPGAPAGSRSVARVTLQIPGLERPHLLEVLMRAGESGTAE